MLDNDILPLPFRTLVPEDFQGDDPRTYLLAQMNKTWISVQSSMISGLAYNVELALLAVMFNRGGIWLYAEVPEFVFDALVDAPSVGKFLNSSVKGIYQEMKVK